RTDMATTSPSELMTEWVNSFIAERLGELADLLEQQADRFRVRAYRHAADTIASSGEDAVSGDRDHGRRHDPRDPHRLQQGIDSSLPAPHGSSFLAFAPGERRRAAWLSRTRASWRRLTSSTSSRARATNARAAAQSVELLCRA